MARAAQLYGEAAECGHVQAMLQLGVCYEDGKGVRRDVSRAAGLYARAADLGSSRAESFLERLQKNAAAAAAAKAAAAST